MKISEFYNHTGTIIIYVQLHQESTQAKPLRPGKMLTFILDDSTKTVLFKQSDM